MEEKKCTTAFTSCVLEPVILFTILGLLLIFDNLGYREQLSNANATTGTGTSASAGSTTR